MAWVGPAFISVFVIVIFPMAFLYYLMFFSWGLNEPWEMRKFVGLGNFSKIFTCPLFRNSVIVTAVFVALVVLIEFFLGFLIANLLNRKFKGKTLVLSLLIVPMVIPPVVVGAVWGLMYNYQYGVIPYIVKSLFGTCPIPFSKEFALPSVIIVDVWQWTGFVVLLLHAGLQTVPKDVVEAAKLDGVGTLKLYRHILIPMLRPIILVTVLLRLLDSFRTFDTIYVLTSGGPGGRTEVLTLRIFSSAFMYSSRVGYASAAGILLTTASLLVCILLIKRWR